MSGDERRPQRHSPKPRWKHGSGGSACAAVVVMIEPPRERANRAARNRALSMIAILSLARSRSSELRSAAVDMFGRIFGGGVERLVAWLSHSRKGG